MTERVTRLRKQSLETKPSLSIERAKLVTEAYKRYAGTVSTPVLRALTFQHIMENKTIYIGDGELIVGERGPGPQQTPTYPELCCHSLADFEVIHNRGKISFSVSTQAREIQESEIIPYWSGRSIRDKLFEAMTSEWKECYQAGIFTEFMEQRAPGHTVADDKIYHKGFLDFRLELEESLENLDFFDDPEAYDKQEQLKAMIICVDAIITFAQRHARLASELAGQETDPQRKEELERIADISSCIPSRKPQSFWEALQTYWYVHLGVITELNTWDSFNPGRLDQHLYSFYKKDIEEGILTREEAKELLQCFWIKFNNQPAPPKVGITLAESGTYTDFANINIGGMKPDGSDGVNPVTYLLLEVVEEMRLLQPSSNIQVSRKNSDHFIKKAGEIIRKGWGQPSVFNADGVVQQLLRQGKSLIDARSGGTSGCVEAGAFGKESYILTGYLNLVKILEITMHNGIDPRTGRQLGLKTGDAASFNSFEQLFDAYKEQLAYFVDIKIRGNNIIERLYATTMPAPFLSIIISDCIQKGKDYNAGGARYNTTYIQGVGIGSLTDSLSSINHHVFTKKSLTMEEMLKALKNNFEGHERVRQLALNRTPCYGNDDDRADEIMAEAFEAFREEVEGRKNTKGGVYRIDMLPTTCHVYFGSVIGATPDGRRSGQPLSEGISPVQGVDRQGPTAVIKSASKMDHVKTGGTLLNMKFSPQVLGNGEGIENLVHLIRTYFRMDGHHIQFNVVDGDMLRAAKQNPDEYRDLIVRVAGYSDYFCNLTEPLQDEIIARTEHRAI